MQNIPSGICDFCSQPFYYKDYRLKQVSNECHDLFKLEFCNSNCLKSIQIKYPFVESFKFKNIQILQNMNREIYGGNSDSDSESDNDEKDNIINTFITNFPSVVFDFSGEKPVKRGSCEMIKYYVDLKKKEKEIIDINCEDKYFLEFADKYKLFNISK